jgi:hypothetical protein
MDMQVLRHSTTVRCCLVSECSTMFHNECLEIISYILRGISTNIKHLYITNLFLRVLNKGLQTHVPIMIDHVEEKGRHAMHIVLFS